MRTPETAIRKKERLNEISLAPLRNRVLGRYPVIAERAGVSWHHVWAVLHGRKTSARVLSIAIEVANERVS